MNEEIIYEPRRAFRIARRDEPRPVFGAFFFTRLLYWLECEGRPWQENTFAAVVGLLTLPALALDCGVMIFFYSLKFFYKILLSLFRLLIYAAKKILDSVSSALKFFMIVSIIIIIVMKWDAINKILALLDF